MANFLHVKLGDNPFNNEIGFYALPIGSTSGKSTVDVSLEANGHYWVGVGYVAIVDPSGSETPDSSQRRDEDDNTIESGQLVPISFPVEGGGQ